MRLSLRAVNMEGGQLLPKVVSLWSSADQLSHLERSTALDSCLWQIGEYCKWLLESLTVAKCGALGSCWPMGFASARLTCIRTRNMQPLAWEILMNPRCCPEICRSQQPEIIPSRFSLANRCGKQPTGFCIPAAISSPSGHPFSRDRLGLVGETYQVPSNVLRPLSDQVGRCQTINNVPIHKRFGPGPIHFYNRTIFKQ